MHLITDEMRRRRLAVRHGLHPEHRVGSVLEATRAMTVLHATEPSTVHLAVRARAAGVSIADVDAALYRDRTVVKQLAMRRTLWAAPDDLLPALWGSASARVGVVERARLAKEVEASGIAADGPLWLTQAVAAIEELLADGAAMTAAEVRLALPEFSGRVERSSGKVYSTTTTLIPNVLTLMGAEARIVRGANSSHWRVSRPRWMLTSHWLRSVPTPLEAGPGYAEIVRRWLRTFGPGVEADLVWWLGSTKTAVRQALAELGAVQVALESDEPGWVLADDVESPEDEAELSPWAALLPTLDPTTMGWRRRDWYLPPEHVRYLFDSVGNGGTTIWLNGRAIGAWVQDDSATVVPLLLEPVTDDERRLIEVEAAELTAWLGGEVITNVYKSSLMKGEPLP